MRSSKKVYWNETKQTIRWTLRDEFDHDEDYSFIGWANEPELDVFIEIVFTKYGDNRVSFEQVLTLMQSFRNFIDSLKEMRELDGLL
jgi:hypothetical protein